MESVDVLVSRGIDHAWGWFSLHASQRMQAVNFFLLASAFLSAAYVSALRFGFPGVAAGVGTLGVVMSVCFYLFEVRIRELLKASEAALYPAQSALAELTGVPELNICKAIETPKRRYTAYSKILKVMYWVTALVYLSAVIYAGWVARSSHEVVLSMDAYRWLLVLAAVFELYLGQKIVSRERTTLGWLQGIVGVILVGAGAVVLLLSALRLPR